MFIWETSEIKQKNIHTTKKARKLWHSSDSIDNMPYCDLCYGQLNLCLQDVLSEWDNLNGNATIVTST